MLPSLFVDAKKSFPYYSKLRQPTQCNNAQYVLRHQHIRLNYGIRKMRLRAHSYVYASPPGTFFTLNLCTLYPRSCQLLRLHSLWPEWHYVTNLFLPSTTHWCDMYSIRGIFTTLFCILCICTDLVSEEFLGIARTCTASHYPHMCCRISAVSHLTPRASPY